MRATPASIFYSHVLALAALTLAACAVGPPPAPPVPAIPMDRCEACHNSTPHPGCDGVRGTADDAPNVMGDGRSGDGAGKKPKAYDDGTFGFTVNGHGANGTAARTPLARFKPDLACADCHDVSSPPGTHYSCGNDAKLELNTLLWPGKPADTRTANTAHLVAGYLGAGTARERQVAFDDYCAKTCHPATGLPDMRHSYDANKNIDPADKVMEFGTAHATTDDPKRERGLDRKLTPWTINDLTKPAAADPSPVQYYGICVSCHDPHGTATLQKTRGTNKMVLRNWQDTSMQPFCGSTCHVLP